MLYQLIQNAPEHTAFATACAFLTSRVLTPAANLKFTRLGRMIVSASVGMAETIGTAPLARNCMLSESLS
jgi:hypothetical protein